MKSKRNESEENFLPEQYSEQPSVLAIIPVLYIALLPMETFTFISPVQTVFGSVHQLLTKFMSHHCVVALEAFSLSSFCTSLHSLVTHNLDLGVTLCTRLSLSATPFIITLFSSELEVFAVLRHRFSLFVTLYEPMFSMYQP